MSPRILLLPCLLGALAATSATAEPRVLNDDAHFAEGPVWYHGKLYYVEYDRNAVMTWDGAKNRVFWQQPGCGPSAVIATPRGEFLVTCYDHGTIGHISADGKDLPPYTHDRDGHPFVGPNDFAPDHRGGMYFTCSGTAPGPVIDGKIFYLAPDGTITQQADKVHSANGIVVSNDGHILYAIETEEHRLLQFDIQADGTLADRRVFLNLDTLTGNVGPIYPDGVKIDSHGLLYIGQNPRDVHAPLAGTIFVVDDTGTLRRTLKLPSPGVPNLALSPDERTVYVMALDQLDRSPYRGKVYAIENR
ncbi:MAG: SMP-30/gluconolactonase/LRE family protein [Gammaproteobacteria bacterium]|nr:SMP-30/gluconolactonase/LRE family protein [Gammaproteobacteria bacterium]MBV9620425.1 SMP-30/gluconolactonase/LRE family protein [Gammaproteobacteria bacterium]